MHLRRAGHIYIRYTHASLYANHCNYTRGLKASAVGAELIPSGCSVFATVSAVPVAATVVVLVITSAVAF